tara:strand:- start:378 stop:500 length:123 start_codon:yes stop_codon:yes gene_type:complete
MRSRVNLSPDGNKKEIQIGGRNILSEWDLTHGIDSDIIPI